MYRRRLGVFVLIYFNMLLICCLSLCSLFNLYNLLGHPNARFQVYMKALELAVNGKVTEYIVPSFKKMDSFLKEWNIDIKDQRQLFLAIANVLRENKRYCYDVPFSRFCLGIPMASCFFF